MSVSFLDPETDIMDQFLETDFMGERNFMDNIKKYAALISFYCQTPISFHINNINNNNKK